eukprot:snap_masked-scaffold17_size721972-processed-gene-0.12 protein:Tk09952 transcript:snap_masked-scaffold17_size721972-processed-gene-0.12-mRNA-1 annotation:"sugar transporter erd6-like 16-like"
MEREVPPARLIFFVAVGILPGFAYGLVLAYSAPALVCFKNPNCTNLIQPMTEEEGSWFVSILYISQICGTLGSSMLADILGRKTTLVVSTLVSATGWMGIYAARETTTVLVGRLVCGFGTGFGTPTGYMYLSEIATTRWRGCLTILNTFVINIGMMAGLVASSAIDVQDMPLVCTLPLAAFLMLIKFIPESPIWLGKGNQEAKAFQALQRLRQDRVNSGADVLSYYSVEIFAQAQLGLKPYPLAILLQVVFTIGGFGAIYLMLAMKRKTQISIFGSLFTFFILAMGISMKMTNNQVGFKMSESKKVHTPMILKMEKICKGYIDQLEKGGKEFNIQNFMIMYIFGSTNNTEYRTKLFDHWPSYLEDFAACKEIMGYRYPDTLCEEFLNLKLDKDVRILDVACGAGNVAYILKDHGYTNIDGLDPSSGLLKAAQTKKLFKNTFCCYVSQDEKTPIDDSKQIRLE